ncbi:MULTISPECIES: TonB-dependent receptor [unclassified Sphingomonas]|uniref:TonB-dependent receptor n=1 Tax=unclassified Sphingomonas TaxID=196159 RepID=UPI000E713574|nr:MULTISPECIES: TonB-dependent receptor [unclassified Sphingomonas]RKE53280.1 iron complex outermembrane receptor protein [Sphingomonas sp. PP-CC-1A-547]TCM09774.1 iron complex outermembrane receptor protein [Sphingomonas sp. PP-CC-3G-468]
MSLTLALLLAGQAATVSTPAVPPQTAAGEQADAQANGRLGNQQQGGGGDVVVTARRRAETIQTVPIAMSVIGGTALAETGAYNVSRLTQLQPTLQFYSTNPRNSAANIRGLGAPFGLTNDGIEQGVGIYVDQVYYSRIASATFDFTDTERIEVLRGPQGTLYGKNTTAGAINITTRKPSFTPEARIELTTGNYQFIQAKASVSGPLIPDKLAIRLSASVTERDGTIHNVVTGKNLNAQDNKSVRGQLYWKPTETLDFALSGDYGQQNPDCCVQYYVRTGATQRPLIRQYAALAAAQGYVVPSTNAFDRVTDVDTPLRAKQELGGVSLLGNLDLGAATITSVSAWRFWHWDPSNDRDFIGLPITTVSANPSQQTQYSQELRIASNGKHTLDYVLGAFYFYQTIDTQGLQVQGPAASAFLLNPTSTGGKNPATLNGLTARNTIGFKNTSAALFGKLTWNVSDRFQITPGLRLNYDKKKGDYVSVVTTGAGELVTGEARFNDQRGVLAPQSYRPDFDNWNLSGDITAAYTVTSDIHAYATYARSYKSGGINLSGLPLDGSNNPILLAATVKPEKVNHYELGLKTQFLDRRLTLNLAGFWTEISDYQATVTNGQLGVLRGYLANAGKVRTRGLEFDSAFRPTDRFSVYANGAYTDAKYVKFVDAPCPPELSGGSAPTATNPAQPAGTGTVSPANCDISGQRLPGVSKWAFSYGAEYDLPATIGGVDGQVYLGYDGSYRSTFSSNPSRSLYTDIKGYALSNFRLGFKAKDSWNVFGWLRNAFDHNYYEVLALQSGSTGLVVGQPGDPRTYGLTVSRSF